MGTGRFQQIKCGSSETLSPARLQRAFVVAGDEASWGAVAAALVLVEGGATDVRRRREVMESQPPRGSECKGKVHWLADCNSLASSFSMSLLAVTNVLKPPSTMRPCIR